ncbi:MAG: hypothetical protein AAGJ81_15990 [Verrucomicrobiota bacterium]
MSDEERGNELIAPPDFDPTVFRVEMQEGVATWYPRTREVVFFWGVDGSQIFGLGWDAWDVWTITGEKEPDKELCHRMIQVFINAQNNEVVKKDA